MDLDKILAAVEDPEAAKAFSKKLLSIYLRPAGFVRLTDFIHGYANHFL